jgi:hypothetical protein
MRWAATVALAFGMVLGGCSTAQVTSASVTTLMPDAERWFKLSWETTPEGAAKPVGADAEAVVRLVPDVPADRRPGKARRTSNDRRSSRAA